MSTHTPGPWQAERCRVSGKLLVERREGGYKSSICNGFSSVLGHGGTPEGNAALVAAAPDLEAALRKLLELAEAFNEHPDYREAFAEEIAAARYALAKIEYTAEELQPCAA